MQTKTLYKVEGTKIRTELFATANGHVWIMVPDRQHQQCFSTNLERLLGEDGWSETRDGAWELHLAKLKEWEETRRKDADEIGESLKAAKRAAHQFNPRKFLDPKEGR